MLALKLLEVGYIWPLHISLWLADWLRDCHPHIIPSSDSHSVWSYCKTTNNSPQWLKSHPMNILCFESHLTARVTRIFLTSFEFTEVSICLGRPWHNAWCDYKPGQGWHSGSWLCPCTAPLYWVPGRWFSMKHCTTIDWKCDLRKFEDLCWIKMSNWV